MAFDIKKTSHAITMSMQIPAFVIEFFISMSGIEVILLLNDHDDSCFRKEQNNKAGFIRLTRSHVLIAAGLLPQWGLRLCMQVFTGCRSLFVLLQICPGWM